MKNIYFLFLFLVCSNSFAETIVIRGQAQLWKSSICPDRSDLCQLPQPLRAPIQIEFQYEKPIENGKFKISDFEVNSPDYKFRLTQFWVQLAPPQISYIITQLSISKLTDKATTLLGLCSRYDAVESFRSLPPGACSGLDSETQNLIGVSLSALSR